MLLPLGQEEEAGELEIMLGIRILQLEEEEEAYKAFQFLTPRVVLSRREERVKMLLTATEAAAHSTWEE